MPNIQCPLTPTWVELLALPPIWMTHLSVRQLAINAGRLTDSGEVLTDPPGSVTKTISRERWRVEPCRSGRRAPGCARPPSGALTIVDTLTQCMTLYLFKL